MQRTGGQSFLFEIAAISMAAILLEISYTRIFSFKVYYYFTYLILGVALLGLGSGGVLVAISGRHEAGRATIGSPPVKPGAVPAWRSTRQTRTSSKARPRGPARPYPHRRRNRDRTRDPARQDWPWVESDAGGAPAP